MNSKNPLISPFLSFSPLFTSFRSPHSLPLPRVAPPLLFSLSLCAVFLDTWLTGPEVVGSAGDAQAAGQICVALYRLGNDYNLFYNLTSFTAKPGAPTSAVIARNSAGKAGPTVLELAGANATWTNVTRPPPRRPKVAPTYIYNLKGTWLKANTLNATNGKTVSNLIIMMTLAVDTYYGQFATPDFAAGEARGQFTELTSQPTPAGQSETDGKSRPFRIACPLPKPAEAAALGNLIVILGAPQNGSEIVGSKGDAKANGRICLAVYELAGDYNIFFFSLVTTYKTDAPTSAFIGQGLVGKAGSKVLEIVGVNAKWKNVTVSPPPPPDSNKTAPPPFYSYTIQGTLLNASTRGALNGKSVKSVIDDILLAPNSSHYAGFASAAHKKGVARGQIRVLVAEASQPIDTFIGLVGAQLNGSSADVNATGSLSLAVILNAATNDYDITYSIDVLLTNPGEPTRVVIMKGADVALTVATSSATWTNLTVSDAERTKLIAERTSSSKPCPFTYDRCQILKAEEAAKLAKLPPLPPLGYTYGTNGTWLSASTLKADNGQTYKELLDAMLAAPDAYSALVFAKVEAGAASGMVLERAAVSTAEYTAHYMMDGGVEEVLESRYIHVAATATSAAAASLWPGTGQHTSTRHVAGRRDGQPSASFNSGGRSDLRDTDVKDDGSTGGGKGRMAEVLEGGGESGEVGEALGGKSRALEVESAPSLQSQRSMAEHIGAVRGDMQGAGARGGNGEAEVVEKREGAGRDGNGGEPGGNGGRGEGAVWVDDLDGKGYVSLGKPTNVEVGSTEGLLGNLAHVAPMDRLDSARLAEPEPEPVPAANTDVETGTATAPESDKTASCPHAATGLVGAGGGKVVNAMGMRVRIKAEAEQTGGSYSVIEYEVPAGEGSEEHIHTREHEAWFLLDGQMTWTIEKKTYQASQGSFMHMPLGRAHSFRNDSDQPARMLVVCMPGGLEKYFLEIGDPEEAATIGLNGAVHKPVVDQAKLQNAIKKAMLYGLVYPKGSAA
ncbi:unnamed protein product [Closterium sp. Naga37s-1]|nr:unnamed protein product [Closterium sp. Naga37s-1]